MERAKRESLWLQRLSCYVYRLAALVLVVLVLSLVVFLVLILVLVVVLVAVLVVILVIVLVLHIEAHLTSIVSIAFAMRQYAYLSKLF